jgi:serine/threonine protein kinase
VSTGENERLAGRYRLVEQLGRGGMGVVWRAVDEVLGREVAVKELRTYTDSSAPELADLTVRMQREARAAARVRHPGVVAVHDVAEHEGRPVIVMELVDGPSLDDVLNTRGVMDPREAAGIGASVLEALGAAHRAGVLHRDVKPGNVLLDRSGRVVLTDFGIAAMDDPGDGSTSHLTRSGEIVGSLDYLAPERAQGNDPGPASDVWALGATLYAAVEGSSPFRRTSTWSTLTAIVAEPLPEPRRAGTAAADAQGPGAAARRRRGGADAVGRSRRSGSRRTHGAARSLGGRTAGTGAAQGADRAQRGAVPAAGLRSRGLGTCRGRCRARWGVVRAAGSRFRRRCDAGRRGVVPAADSRLPRGGHRRAVGSLRSLRRPAGPARSQQGDDRRGGRRGPARRRRRDVRARRQRRQQPGGALAGGEAGGPSADASPSGDTPGTSPAGEQSPTTGTGPDDKGTDGKKSPSPSSKAPAPGGTAAGSDSGGSTGGSGSGSGPDGGSDGGASGGSTGGSTGGSSTSGGAAGAGGTTGGGTAEPAPACHAIGAGKYNCQVWKTAHSYNDGGAQVGVLNAGTNYFYCQSNLGRRETSGEWTNVWWAKTDDDSGNRNVWVSDVYVQGGANDEPVPGLPVC